MLATNPAPFSCRRICTRNRSGIPWASAIALTRTGWTSPRFAANSSIATHAYSALAETLMSLDSAAAFVFDHVETAFLFRAAGPAPGTLVGLVSHCLGAGPTADARIALVVQRIVRHVVLDD